MCLLGTNPLTALASVLSWTSVQRFSRDTEGETVNEALSQREQFETLQFNVIGLLLKDVEKQLVMLKQPKRSPFKNTKETVEKTSDSLEIEQILDLFMKEDIFKSIHNLVLRLELALVDDLDPDAEVRHQLYILVLIVFPSWRVSCILSSGICAQSVQCDGYG